MKNAFVFYGYGKCSTCRDALKWLKAHGVAFEERPIEKTPPTKAELKAMVAALGGNMRKVFNTSGMEYRKLGLAQKLDGMSEEAAYGLLAGNGMLVKRPFVLGGGVGLVGFDEHAWAAALAQ